LAEIKRTAGSHSAKGNPAGDAEALEDFECYSFMSNMS